MGLFKSLFSRPLEALNPPPTVEIPEQLPNIQARTADEIFLAVKPQGDAEAVFNPEQTPSEYLAALQEKHCGDDMIKVLAHGMPDREGISWATQSAGKVSDKLPPKDAAALQAAQAWLQDPNEGTRAAAGKAASDAGLQGPGAWAAQAVAWSSVLAAGDDDSGRARKPRLAPQAVAAAVMMSAAIASNPDVAPKEQPAAAASTPPDRSAEAKADTAQVAPLTNEAAARGRRTMFRTQQPFIAQGVAIASGQAAV